MGILQRIRPLQQKLISDSIQNKVCISQLKYFSTSPLRENLKTNETNATISENARWRTIYRLPIVRWASAFNRLKVYQGAITIAGIPITIMLEHAELLGPGAGAVFAAIGTTGLLTLSLSSFFVKDLIGFIYISDKSDKLKFAIVDYWGRRRDVLIDIQDLVPDGAQEKPTRYGFFQKIGTLNNDKLKLKLLQHHGVIVEPAVFESLFY